MTCWAFFSVVSSANARPVFGLRSKRGKLLLEISRRIECPARKALLVTPAWMVNGYTSPGCANSGLPQGSSRVHQHILALLNRPLVHGAPRENFRIAAHRAAAPRHGIAGIVGELVEKLTGHVRALRLQQAIARERVGRAFARQVERSFRARASGHDFCTGADTPTESSASARTGRVAARAVDAMSRRHERLWPALEYLLFLFCSAPPSLEISRNTGENG